ncbi:JAB domain-containing protein [Nubsella zeaxanthinifaciens]|uniref:JAB domain-containing protein n=1 Tax=Nubsella zeaxanthinifaciens TaxID=392412 RepID=UPI003D06DFAC
MKASSENQLMTVSEITLSYHPAVKPMQRPIIKTPREAYQLFLKHWDMDKIYLCEQCYMLLLNRRGNVLGMIELSSGGISGTVVDVKLVFATALKACASSMVLAHNHPSGDVLPSEQDKAVTRRIAEAGKLLGIELADHLIISPERYLSMAEENYF